MNQQSQCSPPKSCPPLVSSAVLDDLKDAKEAQVARLDAEAAAAHCGIVHEREVQEAVTALYAEYGGKCSISFSPDHRRFPR